MQAIKRAGVKNPVFILTKSTRSGPTGAVIPRQRSSKCSIRSRTAFRDHYLDVDFDLNRCSSSAPRTPQRVPAPLLDRMEVIQLDGYGV